MLKLIGFVVMFVWMSATFAQTGRKFLLIFPPDQEFETRAGLCQIIINTDSRAQVSIHYLDTTDNVIVEVGSYIHDLPCEVRANMGYSNKGVQVESDQEISVQVYTTRASVGDTYLALPSENRGTEYILVSTHKPCETYSINIFYTVAAEQFNTIVYVYAPALGGYTLVDIITLNSRGTYTSGSTSASLDYTGWKLVSSSPISIVSGSACSAINIDSCGARNGEYMFSPSTQQAGRQFIVPKITKQNPGNSGAFIRVISFTENNLIQLPDQFIQETLNSGQFMQHYINPYDEITRIDCKERCIVIVYNELACSSGEGGFLMYVTPLSRGTDYVRFTALEGSDAGSVDNFITIISETQNVMLDGSPVTGWRNIPGWNYFDIAVPLDDGGHTLTSADGGNFTAFVYGHRPGASWGFGTEIVRSELIPQTTTAVPEEPTTIPEEEPTTMPEEVLTTIPVEERTTMPEKEPTTMPEEERTTMPEEEPTTMHEEERTTMPEEEPTTMPEVEPTTMPEEEPTTMPEEEPTTIIDALPTTIPNELPTSTTPDKPVTVPAYRISLISNWTSDDDMETQCTHRYTNELRQKTLQMAVMLNQMIGDTLCADFSSDDKGFTSSTSAFYSDITSGYAFVSFVLTPKPHVAMGDVLLCASEIIVYAKPHINWGAPLLDPIPDCAYPVFETGLFYDGDHQWLCQNENPHTGLTVYISSIPSYYVELLDVGKTEDDSQLSPECAFRYSLSLDDKALWMRSQLKSRIGSQLCQGMSGIDIEAPQTSFTVQGNSALIHIDFILTHDSSVSGGEALMCADDVLKYTQCYDNWQPPLLPPSTGCPAILLNDPCFDESNQGWICNL